MPDFSHEKEAVLRGFSRVAGVDEVGRGPLAGPVVAASVVLVDGCQPNGLDDSKKLSEKKREALFQLIMETCHVGICSLPARIVDEHNIRRATHLAMVGAIRNLAVPPDFVLIDGRETPADLAMPSMTIIKGDSASLSIAAASIVAKVTRDRMLVAADRLHPTYGFASHKGYGAKKHRDAIHAFGPLDLHRRSFEPIKSMERKSPPKP